MATWNGHGRSACNRCGEWVLVNLDGALRKHRRFVTRGKYGPLSGGGWVLCEPPKEA